MRDNCPTSFSTKFKRTTTKKGTAELPLSSLSLLSPQKHTRLNYLFRTRARTHAALGVVKLVVERTTRTCPHILVRLRKIMSNKTVTIIFFILGPRDLKFGDILLQDDQCHMTGIQSKHTNDYDNFVCLYVCVCVCFWVGYYPS